jgi:hypothetical protein
MTKDADDFNAAQLEKKVLKIEHITELVTYWQDNHPGLDVDGKAGVGQTIPSIEAAIAKRSHSSTGPAGATGPAGPSDELSIADDWLVGPNVTRIDTHESWFGGSLAGGKPSGIVAHYSATNAGTAINMAKRRTRKYGEDPDDRLASWHITVETDGSIVVMIPLSRVAWHAGSNTAQPVPGLGTANAHTVGIELVGFGKEFPPAQVTAASKVWRALIKHYGIAREHAMISHQSIDPTRREDPGPVWMNQHAQTVLDFCYRP